MITTYEGEQSSSATACGHCFAISTANTTIKDAAHRRRYEKNSNEEVNSIYKET
jgi:hypothetical protein